jgi:hypothetical protein
MGIRKFHSQVMLLLIFVFLCSCGVIYFQDDPDESNPQLSEKPFCSTFAQLEWGSGEMDLGSPYPYTLVAFSSFRKTIPAVVFDQKGNVYLYDVVNSKVMVFDERGNFIQNIPVPEHFAIKAIGLVDFVDGVGLYYGDIAIRNDEIVIRRVDESRRSQLSFLSVSGNITHEIPLSTTTVDMLTPVLQTDSYGGIYIRVGNSFTPMAGSNGLHYISPDLKQEIMDQSFQTPRNIPPAFIVGWDGYLYRITDDKADFSGFLKNPVIDYDRWKISTDVEFFKTKPEIGRFLIPEPEPEEMILGNFLGVDRDSSAYIVKRTGVVMSDKNGVFYFREFPEDIIISGYSAWLYRAVSLSPSGDIYLLSYDEEDIEVQPSIKKCRFFE